MSMTARLGSLPWQDPVKFLLTLTGTEPETKMADASGKDHYCWKGYNPLGVSKGSFVQ